MTDNENRMPAALGHEVGPDEGYARYVESQSAKELPKSGVVWKAEQMPDHDLVSEKITLPVAVWGPTQIP